MLKKTDHHIWLIDASSYVFQLEPELNKLKKEYFQIENYSRKIWFGNHPARGTRPYSLGLLQIAGLLGSSGHKVSYFTLDEIEAQINDSTVSIPNVVGFYAITPTIDRCARLSSIIKKRFRNASCVVGGPHAISAPILTRKKYGIFDKVVTDRGKSAANTLAPILPIASSGPNYQLLRYHLREYAINLITNESCPYSCRYCYDGKTPMFQHEKDGGLNLIIGKVPRKTPIHFCDSIFGGNPHRALEACKALERLDHGMLLSCDLRAEYISKEMVEALLKAGFGEIRIGLDSADTKVLRSSRRTCLPEEVTRALKIVRRNSDLYISIYLVTGLPGSRTESGKKNEEIVSELFLKGYANQIKHHLYVPYPEDSSQIDPDEVRLINHDFSLYDRNSYPVYSLPHRTSDQIWDDYIRLEKANIDSWRSALKLNISEIKKLEMYSDYNVRQYINKRV